MDCLPADTWRFSSSLDTSVESTTTLSTFPLCNPDPIAQAPIASNESSPSTPSCDACMQDVSTIPSPSAAWFPRVPSEEASFRKEPESLCFENATAVAKALVPSRPVTLLRPHAAAKAAQFFVKHFPGTPMYAVKANPSADIIRVLWENGIHQFDVASITEVRLARSVCPTATLCFMHPVKAAEAIAEAYFVHGVRTFSLDTMEELVKIMIATNQARDLTLCVRLRVSSEHALVSLGCKFGACGDDAARLLRAVRLCAARAGVCFHVGSQTMEPSAYAAAMEVCADIIARSGVVVDIVDVGGGFPSAYPGMQPPSLHEFFHTISTAFAKLALPASTLLWAEPGRSLCNEFSSVLVRVERRRGETLDINDGAYGSLFDATHLHWKYPMKLVKKGDMHPEMNAMMAALLAATASPAMPFAVVDGTEKSEMNDVPSPVTSFGVGAPADESDTTLADFAFWGPTCDDMDFMPGPFPLPSHTNVGDYIEVGMIGAYGASMRTGFNGFGVGLTVTVTDAPMESMYNDI